MPCGSNWACDENFGNLVSFYEKNISLERKLGYLMAPWAMTVPEKKNKSLKALDLAAAAFRGTESKNGSFVRRPKYD